MVVYLANCKFCAGLVVTIVTGLLQFQLYFNDVFLSVRLLSCAIALIISILIYSQYSLYIVTVVVVI